MKYLSDREYNSQMRQIKIKNTQKKRMRELKEEKNKFKKKIKFPSTSKLMAFYLFFLLNIVTVFAMVAMWVFKDLTYLGVLITDLASQILVYLIYSIKSARENSKGGITYDLALMQHEPIVIQKDTGIENIDTNDGNDSTDNAVG